MIARHLGSSGVLFLSALAACGCNQDPPKFAEVEGTVTWEGKPLSGALITFQPLAGGGSPSVGVSDDQGRYTLQFTLSQPGAMVGEHRVMVSTRNGDQRGPERVPPEYNQASIITREVAPYKVNAIDLDLPIKD